MTGERAGVARGGKVLNALARGAAARAARSEVALLAGAQATSGERRGCRRRLRACSKCGQRGAWRQEVGVGVCEATGRAPRQIKVGVRGKQ